MQQRIWVVLLMVASVLGVGAMTWWAWPYMTNISGGPLLGTNTTTNRQTTTWKSYTDPSARFSVEYPKAWKATACDFSGVYFSAPTVDPCGVGSESISIVEEQIDVSMADTIESAKLLYKATASTVTIDGQAATRLKGKMPIELSLDNTNSLPDEVIDIVYVQKGSSLWTITNAFPNQEAGLLHLFATLTFTVKSNTNTNTNTTTSATSDWKTYTNSKYGYSIQYPTTWTVVESKDLLAGTVASTVFDNEKVGEVRNSVEVLSSSLTLQQWADTYKGAQVYSSTATTLGDLPALHVKTGEFGLEHIGVKKGSYIYVITSNSEMLTNGMIGTFTFDSSVSGSHTYSNDTYGFKFSYPRTYSALSMKTPGAELFWSRNIYTYTAAAPVDAKKKVSPLVLLSTSPVVAYALPVFDVAIYPLDQYTMSDKPGATLYGYDVATKKFWKSDGLGAPTTAGSKTLAGKGITGYLLGTGDMGSLTQMVAFPVTSKNVMVELSFSSVAALEGDDAKTTKDTTSWKKDIAATFELLK